jgi:hypothetical protein
MLNQNDTLSIWKAGNNPSNTLSLTADEKRLNSETWGSNPKVNYQGEIRTTPENLQ